MAYTLDYHPIGSYEEVSSYGPGGFLPVMLGDSIGQDGRFYIVEKLGRGGYATVWLCRDLMHETWKAVKIIRASASDEDSCAELRVLNDLSGVDREELDANHICLAEEYFWEQGHLCLVLPVLGESITDLWEKYGDRPDILKHICAQMVEAMSFLHSKGICHNDFRPGNILFKLKDIDNISQEEMIEMLPQSEEIAVVPRQDVEEFEVPAHLPQFVYTATCIKPKPKHVTFDIVISDFGESFHVDKPMEHKKSGIPRKYAAPEILLGGAPLGFGTDIWALGSTICEVRQGYTPCSDEGTRPAVRRLEQNIGPIPEPFRSQWFKQQKNIRDIPASEIPLSEAVTASPEKMEKSRQKHFDSRGCHTFLEQCVWLDSSFGTSLKDGEMPDLKPNQHDFPESGFRWTTYQTPTDEAEQLLDLLYKIFKWLPAERLSGPEILAHPWLDGQLKNDAVFDLDDTSKYYWVPCHAVKDGSSRVAQARIKAARDAAAGITVEDHHVEETTPEEVQCRDPTMPQFRPLSSS
jgi:serine/threonine-protein kinase SRPK3